MRTTISHTCQNMDHGCELFKMRSLLNDQFIFLIFACNSHYHKFADNWVC